LHALKSLKAYITLTAICLLSSPMMSQLSNSKGFGFEFHPGYLMAHRVDMQEMEAHIKTFQFHYINRGTGSEYWDNWFNKPRWGVTLEYLDLGNEINGEVLALMPFIRVGSSKIHKNPRYFEIAMGIGYFNNPFDVVDNHLNRAIGSRLNAGVRVALYQTIKLTNQFDASFGIGMTHFSNGNAVLPNLGINIPHVQFGIDYFPLKSRQINRHQSNRNHFSRFELGVAYGKKQEDIIDDVKIPLYMIQGTYLFSPKKTRAFRLGLDFMIDNSYNYDFLNPKTLENTSLSSKSELAIRIGHEYRLNMLSLITDLGIYTFRPNKTKKASYQNIGLRVHPNKRFYMGWHLKTHMFIADYFAYSVGYKFAY
jgi:hypothetical protein